MNQDAFRILSDKPEPKKVQPKKKKGGFLTSLLPIIGGGLGAVGGSFVAPVAGTAAGGAAGSALGEFLRQKITGDTEGGLGNIVREGAFGAIPGVGKVAKGGVAAVRAAREAKALGTARQGAAGILGNTAVGGVEAGQASRTASAGKNISALLNNQRRTGAMAQNTDNEQFNRLAAENIQRLASRTPATVTAPDRVMGGSMDILGKANLMEPRSFTMPGATTRVQSPSFASEGVTPRPDVQVPNQLPLTPTPPTTATEILNPTPLTERAVAEARPVNGMARTAERLFGRSTGIQPGAKVGSQQLSAKRAAELKDHVRTNIGSKPTDAADTILRRNEAFLQNKANELDDVLIKKNVSFSDADANKLLGSIKKPVGISLENNQTYQQTVTDLLAAAKKGGYRDGELVRREIDKQIKFNRDSASPDPQREQIMLAIRNAWDKQVTKKIPESKPIKRDLSKAYDTQTYIQKSADAPGGFGPFGLKMGGREIQTLSNLTSRGAEVLGGQGAAATTTKQLAGAGLQQGATRLGASALLGTPLVGSGEQPTNQAAVELPQELGGLDALNNTQPGMTEEEAIPQAMQILAMQAAANGDTQQAQQFLAIAKQLGTTTTQNAEIVKAQKKASNASSIINELEDVFSQAGGAKGPITGRATLLGAAAGGGNQAAKAYQDIRGAYTAQISRALGEVGVLTDKDREVVQQAIPSINDSDEAKQIKIATLRNILSDLSSRSSQTQQASSSQDDVLATLQQLGY